MPRATDEKVVLARLLRDNDVEQASAFIRENKRLVHFAYRLLFDPDPLLRYKAALAMALALKDDTQKARNIMERLVWAMNDESGNHCPGALVASAQILAVVPDAGKGFAAPIASMVFEKDSLEDALWAVGTLAKTFAEAIRFVIPRLVEFLGEDDPNIRGLALRALLMLGVKIPNDLRTSLLRDQREVRLFEDGREVVTSVCGLLCSYPQNG
jgi:HEAT repeat protein